MTVITKRFSKIFHPLLTVLTLAFGTGSSTLASDSPFASLAASDAEFLPVDQAYQQDFLFSGDNISTIFQIAPGYYLYRDKLALYHIDGGTKKELPLTLPEGEVIWDDYFEKETEVYRLQLEIPLAVQSAGPLQLEIHYQGCADAGLCYPPQVRHFELDPTKASATPVTAPTARSSTPPSSGTDTNTDMTLALAVVLAFAGGLLLNLMPCVFPVLSIKLLAISQTSQQAGQRRLHGWAYSIGVVVSFVLIAALMLTLRAGGEAVGWGFQLQSPWLVAALAYLFFTMGLSLSGLTAFGTRLMGLGSGVSAHPGLRGSFATGALATLVASPCTAPLMGSALGFAVTQPAAVALAVFAALGAGMAAPFLLLTYIPALADRLPRPGPWMDKLKQLLAFPMYLTAVWLLWVLGRQSGSDGVALVLAGAVAIAFALWIWPHALEAGSKWRWGKSAVALLALAFAVGLLPQLNTVEASSETASGYWQPYSPERLEEARSQGRPVLANMTAAWCITCLANEKVVLSSDEIVTAVEQLGVVALKGDWTNQDPQISELLAKYGRTSVPLYLLFPAGGGEAKVLPQILTREGLLAELQSAAEGGLGTSMR
ncbi:protein-disulfide reductase DsbD family protein [Microbulbifer thermotolerans]|uniref:protein-disulfide reductase DsbD family protein n=1 Tax=Microbulbifer thermotolerans TaxID=252514 RepID=UPI0022492670|nr:protein-disulfide reductase DsbD [Microbulbifer thermotolerans]MCX2832584.1 protein-disulfide reductase DsbD [Microbulbifer thermotolerans]MCX2842767.1 protein-disulfide reductase DsbD [Microbulbifer thermotolerans]